MYRKEFNAFRAKLTTLTPKQRRQALDTLQEQISEPAIPAGVKDREKQLDRERTCIHCGSKGVVKNGKAAGLTRFRCRAPACKKTYTALTGTKLAHLHRKEKWETYQDCLRERVVYGYVLHTKSRMTFTCNTQYRRLHNGDWVVDELPWSQLEPVLRPGDNWITGPKEGSIEPDLARVLQSVLAQGRADSVPCWFGIWEGFGWMTQALRAAPSFEAPGRRWHLFRAPLDHLEQPFFEDSIEHQPANLAWPEDRSWCLATEIDAEVTYVGGSKELISAILEAPGIEAVTARLDRRLSGLCDVLQPVVEKPDGVTLPPGFESREYPPDWPHPRLELGSGY